jgi:alpha-galactosidase
MGFNPWTAFRANFNQTVLLEVADALVKTGLKDAGFVYMVRYYVSSTDSLLSLKNCPLTEPGLRLDNRPSRERDRTAASRHG